MTKDDQTRHGIYYLALLMFCVSQVNAGSDDLFYRPLSNLTFIEKSGKTFVIGANLEFTSFNFKTVINVDDKVFLFGTYNFDRSRSSRSDEKTRLNNSGFSIGGGAKKLKRDGYFNEYQILAGIEQQKINFTRIYIKPEYKDRDELKTIFLKPFAQINLIRTTQDYLIIFSARLSLLYFYEYNHTQYSYAIDADRKFQGKVLPFLDPTMTFAFGDLPLEKLTLNAHAGFSIPLLKLTHEVKTVNSHSRKDFWPLRFIFMVGIEYSFGKGANKSEPAAEHF